MSKATRRKNPRLQKELINFKRNAPEGIRAAAQEDNILRWHYVVEGPKGSPYEGGFYHGEIKFPPEYPFKPPSIWMTTPSGRFEPGVRICMSFTDYHPEEWNPAWSASTILTGLLSFMVENERTAGSIVRTPAQRRKFARQSLQWNALNNAAFRQHFPELVELAEQRKQERELRRQQGGADAVDDDADDVEVESGRKKKLGLEYQVVLFVLVLMALYSGLKGFLEDTPTGEAMVGRGP